MTESIYEFLRTTSVSEENYSAMGKAQSSHKWPNKRCAYLIFGSISRARRLFGDCGCCSPSGS